MKNKEKMEAVNTIRGLSIDCINKASSGHPGLPLGAATMAYTLWADHMRHNPEDSEWIGRDRFVLSAGHGSALLYSMLHLFGYNLNLNDLKNFRQLDGKTPGHPEYGLTDGVETTTGPLGQGFGNAVGMEIAREYLSSMFDKDDLKLFDNYTYVLSGDGCIMEGITSEAASLAGHLKLKNLIILYDDNNITIEGDTTLSFSEDVEKKYLSMGFEVFKVNDGNNIDEINDKISRAKKSDLPCLIMVKTIIGYGSPNREGTAGVHGAPLGEEEGKNAKKKLCLDPEKQFEVGEEIKEHFEKIKKKLMSKYDKWNETLNDYKQKYPEYYNKLQKFLNNNFDGEVDFDKMFKFEKKEMATREAGGIVLNILSEKMPNIIGGSADLAPSTKTYLKNEQDFNKNNKSGRNLHFGIREHAMGAIVNGISLYMDEKLRAYGSTFLVFSDYMRGSIRLAALMKIPSVFIFTHDSIGVGEDGPTHQPVEHLMSLRLIPDLKVIRPADARETSYLMYHAFTNSFPTCFALSRQKLPVLENTNEKCLFGAYTLKESKKPSAVILATGSEVSSALEAAKKLEKKNIFVNVVSMPCREIFEMQTEKYQKKILPENLPVLVVECGVKTGWEKYFFPAGDIISIDNFGASGPAGEVMTKFGFSIDNICEKIEKII
ncbi:MAG: transketolase [Candidatus Muiribacteriota bacterium]